MGVGVGDMEKGSMGKGSMGMGCNAAVGIAVQLGQR